MADTCGTCGWRVLASTTQGPQMACKRLNIIIPSLDFYCKFQQREVMKCDICGQPEEAIIHYNSSCYCFNCFRQVPSIESVDKELFSVEIEETKENINEDAVSPKNDR
jgi:hypothetical protein